MGSTLYPWCFYTLYLYPLHLLHPLPLPLPFTFTLTLYPTMGKVWLWLHPRTQLSPWSPLMPFYAEFFHNFFRHFFATQLHICSCGVSISWFRVEFYSGCAGLFLLFLRAFCPNLHIYHRPLLRGCDSCQTKKWSVGACDRCKAAFILRLLLYILRLLLYWVAVTSLPQFFTIHRL